MVVKVEIKQFESHCFATELGISGFFSKVLFRKLKVN